MDLVFCGTPQFAVPTLEVLARAGDTIRLVVCQPDRPSGRGQELKVSVVKERALQMGLNIAQPASIKNNPEFRAQLEALKPQAIVVVAYGRIIPPWMLGLPPRGCVNLHGSLLPKYRGAAPIQWAIANGERETGVTTMRLDEGLDTGHVLLQERVAIADDDTCVTLSPKLAHLGAGLMLETLRQLEAGTLVARPQDDSLATHAPLLSKEDGRIDFALPARDIFNRLRGFQPWPGVYTAFRGKSLQILAAKPIDAMTSLPVGTLRVAQQQLLIGCGEGTALELLQVKPEGKKRMSAAAFRNGYKPNDGEKLGGGLPFRTPTPLPPGL